MLACLMEQPWSGRHAAHRLFDEVWDDEVDIRSNALEVHISRLRDHLTASSNVRISTVRGIGYRLELTQT